MLATYRVMNAVSKTLSLAAFEVRCRRFDTASFLSSLSFAKFEISSERKYAMYKREMSLILDRCEVLYCTAYSAFCKMQKALPASDEVYRASAEIALRCFELFDHLRTTSIRKDFQPEAEKILSDADSFLSHSKAYRHQALSRYKSIGSALFEIEYICSCSELAVRSTRLICAYFELL